MGRLDPKQMYRDPEQVEPGFEPIMHSIHYPSGKDKVHGLLMMAGGRGERPLLLLLHGFPGTERNLDVAQALRMAGCHVAFFHYRGAWGSPGEFSFAHVLEDPHNVLDYLLSPEVAQQYRIDRSNVFVAGHSMGGFAALHTGATRSDLKGCCGIAPYDFGKGHLIAQRSPEAAEVYNMVMGQPLSELRTRSDGALLEEMAAHAQDYALEGLADGLAGKNILLFGFDQDDASVPDLHVEPLVELYGARSSVRYERYDTDHSYNSKRIAVATALCDWMAGLED
ncbi:MAG: alpha/beta fold hydrolase [Clostridiales bacterium]|nr:alpha/beta fold hydrolase [Clostridiales bacterium]